MATMANGRVSPAVAVFCRGGYWKCHMLMGVDNTVKENEHGLHFPLFLRKLIKITHIGRR